MTLNPSKQQLIELRRRNNSFKNILVEIPKEDWPTKESNPKPVRVLRNKKHFVQIFEEEHEDIAARLSINRTEWDVMTNRWKENISWEDIQNIKKGCGYGDLEAVEVFPGDSDVVNVANMRHIWVLNTELPWIWRNKE